MAGGRNRDHTQFGRATVGLDGQHTGCRRRVGAYRQPIVPFRSGGALAAQAGNQQRLGGTEKPALCRYFRHGAAHRPFGNRRIRTAVDFRRRIETGRTGEERSRFRLMVAERMGKISRHIERAGRNPPFGKQRCHADFSRTGIFCTRKSAPPPFRCADCINAAQQRSLSKRFEQCRNRRQTVF